MLQYIINSRKENKVCTLPYTEAAGLHVLTYS